MAPWRPKAKSKAEEVALLNSPSAGDFLGIEQDEAVVRVAQVAVPRQTWRDSPDFSQEEGPVDLVELVLEVQSRRVAAQISAAGVDDGLATVSSSKSQLCKMLLGHYSRLGFGCEACRSSLHSRRLPSLHFNAVREALVIEETMEAGS